METDDYVLALDVGTSTIRCHVYDRRAIVVGAAQCKGKLLYPKQGWVEIEPKYLWESIVTIIKDAIKDANIEARQIKCMGMATLRSTFTTWNKHTGEHYHNFISWNDLRADYLVKSWDSSFSMQGIRIGSTLLHKLTGRSRYLAGSVLRLSNKQANMRLLWCMENIPNLRQEAAAGDVLFGTIDTWLLWKLTGGRVHATDYSCASATALYDPFLLEWGSWAFKLFNIPLNMMPKVMDTCGNFGSCSPELFGHSIPVMALAGDQQAALFGQCCFDVGDVKCSLGTGSFMDINTGNKPHASVAGLYPLIGWRFNNKTVFVVEGSSNDTGNSISWAQSIGLLDNPADSSDIARSVKDSGGVYFIPGFSGLQAPLNDDQACAGIIGLKPTTTKSELVRAVLESIAYRIQQLYEVIQVEANFSLNHIRVDGGVSSNDFVLQLIADMTGKRIERPSHTDMGCLGVAYLAGLAAGVWESQDELKLLHKPQDTFQPTTMTDVQSESLAQWKKAIQRFLKWYPK